MFRVFLTLLALILAADTFAAPIRIDVADIGRIDDLGNDGTADLVQPGIRTRGIYRSLSFSFGQIYLDPRSISGPDRAYSLFTEFDVSAFRGGAAAATLNFTRFLTNGFNRLGEVRVSGYSADGTVQLSDWDLSALELGRSGGTPAAETSQVVSIDITDFLRSTTSDYVGFRFDMTARGAALLWDTSYTFLDPNAEDAWLSRTPVPFLSIDDSAQAVPAPSTLALLGLGLLGFGIARPKA